MCYSIIVKRNKTTKHKGKERKLKMEKKMVEAIKKALEENAFETAYMLGDLVVNQENMFSEDMLDFADELMTALDER
jgi:hypothetical protein